MEVTQFDELTSTVLRAFEASGKVQDQVFNGDPLYAYINKKGGKKNAGGREIQVNLRYKKNDTAGSYHGWDPLPNQPQNTISHAVFGWKQYSVAIAVDGRTIAITDSKEAMLDLVADKTQEAMDSLQDDMTVDLYSNGTGNGGKDLLGLEALVATTGTLGGIDRSEHAWWQAKVFDKENAQLDTEMMRNAINTVRGPGGDPGKMGEVDIILTTQELYESFEGLVEQKYQTQSLTLGELGFKQGLAYKGAEIYWSPNVPAGTIYLLSSKYMGLRVLPSRDFKFSKWREPANQDGRVAYIFWMGNVIASNCRRLGKLINVKA